MSTRGGFAMVFLWKPRSRDFRDSFDKIPGFFGWRLFEQDAYLKNLYESLANTLGKRSGPPLR